MKYFQIMLNAENFLVEVDGKETLLGFYTTRFVEAKNKHEAELKAVDRLKQDEELQNIVLNRKRGIEQVPMIYAEEITEIAKANMQKDYGKTWYQMDSK